MKASLGLRILCVDDDDEIREMLGAILRDEGYDVVLAADASRGLAELAAQRFHLVITDYRLPGENGAWMLREALARGLMRDTEAVLITAGPNPPDAGDHRVYRKPLDIDDFLMKLALLLAPARSAEVEDATLRLAAEQRRATRQTFMRRIEFTLYISSSSPSSLKALRNMQRLVETYEPAHVLFTVCDLSRELPPSLEEDRIAFTPTLIKRFPEPRAWIRGDLDDPRVVEDLLSHSGAELRR